MGSGPPYGHAVGDLVVGTDARTLVTSQAEPGSGWHQVSLPAGEQHAVPAGERLALCGVTPAIVWHSVAFPAPGETCRVCSLLSSSLV